MHCPGGNATDSIWRVLASSDGISSWTPLKPQHSNPNSNPLSNQLWCIDFLTPPTPLIIPHIIPLCLPWISYATQKLMLDSCKMVQKQSEAFHTFLWHFFPSLKRNFIAYRSRPDCIFETHQQWQSGFSRVYSNVIEFSGLHTSGGILSSPVAFLFLIFLSTELSSSWVKGS